MFSVVTNAAEVGPINPFLHQFFSSPDSELKIRTISVWSLSLRHIPRFYYISLRSFHLCELQAGYFNFCEKANRRIFAFADDLYFPLLFPLFRQCRLSRGHSSKWDSGYFTLSNFIKLALFDLITTKVSGRLEVLFFTNVSKHHPLVISCKWLIVGGNNEVSRGRNNRRRKTDKTVANFSTISRLIK